MCHSSISTHIAVHARLCDLPEHQILPSLGLIAPALYFLVEALLEVFRGDAHTSLQRRRCRLDNVLIRWLIDGGPRRISQRLWCQSALLRRCKRTFVAAKIEIREAQN